MKWIGEGVFTWKGKDIKYGEEMPKDVPKERIMALAEKEKVGDIPEKINHEKLKSGAINELKKQNTDLLAENEFLKKKSKKGKFVDELKNQNTDLLAENESLKKELEDLKKGDDKS